MSVQDLPFFPIGSNFENGKDGVSPTINVTEITGGHRLNIVDALGVKTFDVLDGNEGPIGPQGPQGIPGTQGERGPEGEQGPSGEPGLQGERGEKGEKGDKGDKGDTGPQGIQGEKGEKGDKGDQGEQGIQGEKGENGIDGQAGKDGTNGKDGLNGKSAYEYAREKDYHGTEIEFSELLANAVDKRNITLGLHTDGLLYLFINSEPVGTGIALNTSNPETP